MTNVDVDTLFVEVMTIMDVYPELRYGQAWYNVLREKRPELANRIAQTELDPFQRDERVPRLIDWLCAGANSTPQRRP